MGESKLSAICEIDEKKLGRFFFQKIFKGIGMNSNNGFFVNEENGKTMMMRDLNLVRANTSSRTKKKVLKKIRRLTNTVFRLIPQRKKPNL